MFLENMTGSFKSSFIGTTIETKRKIIQQWSEFGNRSSAIALCNATSAPGVDVGGL